MTRSFRPAQPFAARHASLSPSARRHRIARAVSRALVGSAAGATLAAVAPMALAQPADAARSYAIPAGPLAPALNRFGREAGVMLSYAADLADGRQTPGLNGSFSVATGLAALLAGTGLEAVQQGGGYALRATSRESSAAATAATTAAAAAPVMAEVKVTARADDTGTTEGSGSYTTRRADTATGLGLSLRETPQSVTVVTRQRLEDQGLTQLSDVVAQTPGLVITQSGNQGSDSSPIYARGFSVETYMVDGVRQVDEGYTDVFQTADMAIYDRVEIVRGATGLMNGVGTPSAAINLIRKRPTQEFQAQARVELGSWNYRRAEADLSGALNQAGNVRGRLVVAGQENDSYLDRLHERRKILFGTVEADLAPGTLLRGGVSVQHIDLTANARGGLPAWYSDGTHTSWARSDSAAPDWTYSKRHNTTVFAAVEQQLTTDWRLKATLTRAYNKYDEVVGYASAGNVDRATGAGVGIWATHWQAEPRQDSLDLQVNGQFGLFGRRHDLSAGVMLSRTKYEDPTYTNWWHDGWDNSIANIYTWDGSNPAAPANPQTGTFSSDEKMNSAYASARLQLLDPLSLIVGARVTDWSRYQTNYSFVDGWGAPTDQRETGQVTPYLGVVWDYSDHWSAYASYTDIFKPQSQKTVDGSTLDPLIGKAYELGVKGSYFDDRLNLSASIYRIQQDNFAVALTDVFAPDGSQAYEAVSGTTTRGFELEASGELRPGWQLAAGYARNLTRDRDHAPLNTQVPTSTFNLYTSYKLATVGRGLTVGGGVRWQNEIYAVNQGPLGVRWTQPSYAVFDLMARYPFTDTVSGSINVANVFDKSYYTTTGNSYYGMPRQVRAALDLKF